MGRRYGRRRHRLHERSVEMNYIEAQIFPRQILDEPFLCHACWLRAHANITNEPVQPDNIALVSSGQNGSFQVEVDTNLTRFAANKLLLRCKIRSRHVANKQYMQYILLNLNGEDWCQKIEEYYCSCIIGKRTVGSCAHVMTIVWFLGWARFQNNVLPPAIFLDGILVREDIENK